MGISHRIVETLHATSLRGNPHEDAVREIMSAISPKPGSLGAVIRS